MLDRNTYMDMRTPYVLVYVDDLVAALERRWKRIAPPGGQQDTPSLEDIERHAARIGPERMAQFHAFLEGRAAFLTRK